MTNISISSAMSDHLDSILDEYSQAGVLSFNSFTVLLQDLANENNETIDWSDDFDLCASDAYDQYLDAYEVAFAGKTSLLWMVGR